MVLVYYKNKFTIAIMDCFLGVYKRRRKYQTNVSTHYNFYNDVCWLRGNTIVIPGRKHVVIDIMVGVHMHEGSDVYKHLAAQPWQHFKI